MKEKAKKSAAGKTQGQIKKNTVPSAAKALKRTRVEVAAHQLRPAPWNPRLEVTSESVADITASILKVGLIQPLVVIKDPAKEPFGGVDFYLIVAGHRRYRACVDAGLYPIPCDVLECDPVDAKHITMIENLQRKDADPLLESDLIAGLLDGGMTQAEIAAETGRGEKWVARRANLRKLSPSWRKRVKDGENIAIDCLEHVAAYPTALQEELKKEHGPYYKSKDAPLTWGDIRNAFANKSHSLRDALFDTSKCLSCAKNSGCCPGLFDDVEIGEGAQLGRCLDGKCWKDSTKAHVADVVAKKEAKGCTVIKSEPCKVGAYCVTTKRPTKTNTVLYVYKDYSGNLIMEYGVPPKKKRSSSTANGLTAATEAERAEERAKRERNKVIRKLAEWCGKPAEDGETASSDGEASNLALLLEDFFADPMHPGCAKPDAPFVVQEAFRGIDTWHFQGCKTDKTQCAIAHLFGHLAPPLGLWTRAVAAELVKQLDPSKCEGFRAAHNAELLFTMFPDEILRAIGANSYGAICGETPLEKFRDPEIKWTEDIKESIDYNMDDEDLDLDGEDEEGDAE